MSHHSLVNIMHLSSAFPGRRTPGLLGGNQLKLKKSAPQYPGLLVFWAFFLPKIWGHFQASAGGCHCLPLSHCLSDLPRMETLLSDHARRLRELSNFNVKVVIPPVIPRVPHPGKANDRCIIYEISSHISFHSFIKIFLSCCILLSK